MKRDVDIDLVSESSESDEVVVLRRTKRKILVGLKGAFEVLRDEGYEEFLKRDIIKKKFYHVFNLLSDFSTCSPRMKKYWNMYWEGKLDVREMNYWVEQKCIACNKTRKLSYKVVLYKNDGTKIEDPNNLNIMGPDCYEVKFGPLLQLIDICRELQYEVDRSNFNNYAEERLAPILEEIKNAPAIMSARYPKKNRDSDSD